MKKVDDFLNNITMYRLVAYVLGGYSGLGVLFAFLDKLPFSPTNMIISLVLLLLSAYVVDRGFSRLFNTPSNTESWLITALILFLIIKPADSLAADLAIILAGGLSSASKFLIAWNGKHIFNPAALAAAVVSISALQPTTWWIGNSLFWPFTLFFGLLIIRKIKRSSLLISFVAVSVLTQLAVFISQQQELSVGMKGALLASPLIFLGTIMLTEPATMPPRRQQQIIFGTGIAVLYVMGWKIGPFNIYPEVALLIGNIYAFAVSPRFRMRMRLKEIQRVSDQVYNYVFQPDRRFDFIPGQYMEWTLADVPYDDRGNRRTFTIASSPTEKDVYLGVKYHLPASTYKATLSGLKIGDTVYASQLAGNFTLDPQGNDKIAFIAGGIGITPFRSMIKYLVDNRIQRDIVLLYIVTNAEELAYDEDFLAAAEAGLQLKYIPIVTSAGNVPTGMINAKLTQELIKTLIPDAAERITYISGPNRMVDGTKHYLRNLQVPHSRIKTDHFSGY